MMSADSNLSDFTETFTLQKIVNACESSGAVKGFRLQFNLEKDIIAGADDESDNASTEVESLGSCEEAGGQSDKENDPEVEVLREMNSRSPRRRIFRKKNWKSGQEKIKRMKGENYLGFKKNEEGRKVLANYREARNIGPACSSRLCNRTPKRHCSEFSNEVRETIFHSFWSDMNWKQKRTYVWGLVDRIPPKKSKQVGDSRKEITYLHYLKLNGEKKQVCREMFLSTLGLRSKMLQNWLKPASELIEARINPPQKTSRCAQRVTDATSFLNSLPKLPSHYCRAGTKKLYLEPIFSTKIEVYNLYVDKCNELGQPTLGKTKFFDLLESMNIGIFTPKKDLCDTCGAYEAGNLDEKEWKLHCDKKDSARNEKFKDKKEAQSRRCHAICMDLQGVKVVPVLNASALYYKTKLVIHNFTIYDLATRHVRCYVWDESEGDCCSSVFATCVMDYIMEQFHDNLPIIIFSDGCTNQNRNAVMSSAILNYSIATGKIIYQKFLEKGHTQMEVDSVHSTIERKSKMKAIHLPSDYFNLISNARTFPTPYEVKRMTYEDFKNYGLHTLQQYESIRPGHAKGDPKVVDIRQLKYKPNGTIEFKLDYNSDWQNLPHPPKIVQNNTKQPALFSNRRPIARKKHQDLIDLIPVLPSHCHEFYKTLPSI